LRKAKALLEEKMHCPKCSAENPARARFCLECGAPFGTRCAGCGAELPSRARFCLECQRLFLKIGAPIHAERIAKELGL